MIFNCHSLFALLSRVTKPSLKGSVSSSMIGNIRNGSTCNGVNGSTDHSVNRNITVAIEGNIGSGKTSLLKFFKQNSLVEVIEEPVKKWQNVDGNNTLELMYSDPKRWSYLFESYVLLTMMQVHHRLYLRTSPEKCMERIKKRSRDEENSVSMELLNSLHERYEEWLVKKNKFSLPAPVVVDLEISSKMLSYTDSLVSESAMEEDLRERNITVAVEGNIGSGKTTLLNHFRQHPDVEVLEEPVDKWKNVGGKNLLELFYTDCQRWSYLFESYAVLSLMKIHKKPHVTPVKMIERSVYSGYFCFEHNLCKSGMMSKVEHSVHNEWFNWITKQQQPHLDLIIYLKTSPETCMERIKARNRSEEKTIPMELLNALHERHEEWLIQGKFPVPAPVMVVDGNRDLEEMITFYKKNDQYILGMKQWPQLHTLQQPVC
ncbi:thymidine kinase 2, mitochondrial-like [Stylophora pistillata]|uniref:thymidine kinase 2, mitochondrial-like n=1 Tax=Stylophora pistillata TaxID=50429 RepID=UPI000C045F70|nr:thymidine kinase 2, mitochondrial-like [Stylophora pistillata]